VEVAAVEPAILEELEELEEFDVPEDDDAGGACVRDPLPEDELPELPELCEGAAA
jgi:hypothetical protein